MVVLNPASICGLELQSARVTLGLPRRSARCALDVRA